MQANLSHYEDVAELEDDILCFLPTVSDLDVFGCELELLDLHKQQPLSETFRTVLLQRPQLQIVVRLCMVEGHSIWQFQADSKESYPKAVRVPANPRGEIADRAFYAAPSIRHVEVATGMRSDKLPTSYCTYARRSHSLILRGVYVACTARSHQAHTVTEN